MKNPDNNISFVIPAYNCASTVQETVESIFYDNFESGDEIIVINDCSSDKTSDVLEKIKIRHPEIRIVSNSKNLGCPASRNVGNKLAKNGLIFSLDADNILAPNTVSSLKKCLNEHSADAVTFGNIRFFIKKYKKPTHTWTFEYPNLELRDLFTGHTNPAFTSQFLYKKSAWQKISGYWEFGPGLHEGWGFAFKLLVNGARFAVCQNAYYFHRYGHSSLFTRENKKQKEGSSITMKMIEPFLEKFEEIDIQRIQNPEWRDVWFDKLDENPVHLKNQLLGRTAEVKIMNQPTYKKILIKALRLSGAPRLLRNIKNNARYVQDFLLFQRLSKESRRFTLSFFDRKKIIGENTPETKFDTHYIYHPAWAARIIEKTKPKMHTDISSTLSFSSILSAFVPVQFYDYRPAPLQLTNFTSERADLTRLPFANNSLDSLSCMHTIEHIGLGRYGDPLNPDGDLEATRELTRVLAPGGNLLFVVPVGKPKIMFNAHRIYSYDQVLEMFQGLKLLNFSLVPDDGVSRGLITDATREKANKQSYGCGCFWFTKPK